MISERPLEYTSAVSHVLIPRSKACLSNGNASSSFRTQGCQSEEPKVIAPKMIFETLRPDVPRLWYVSASHATKRKEKDDFGERKEQK